MPRNKKGTYTRPEGWEKSIKQSYWDSSKDYTGESYDEYDEVVEEEQAEKDAKTAKKARFGKLISKLFKQD